VVIYEISLQVLVQRGAVLALTFKIMLGRCSQATSHLLNFYTDGQTTFKNTNNNNSSLSHNHTRVAIRLVLQ
jgi:hypothetical protein